MGKCEQCIVREFSSLKMLSKDELLHLADCKTSKEIKKGTVIFEEGEAVNGVYCVKDGVCKLTKLSPNGKDQIVKLVRRGELLGQRSLLSNEPANLNAIALEDMKICYIPKSEVMAFLSQNNKFSLDMIKTICGDLRDADNLMVNMAQKSMRERLAHTLLYLEENFGTYPDNTLKLQLSREDLAGIIGTATESCIRLLSELNKQELIALNGKKISITNPVMLRKIAGDS